MSKIHTIAALCTAPEGALAILRLSGTDALTIANRVWSSKLPLSRENARKMIFGTVHLSGSDASEHCLAVYMPGPASYTGEDVVEIQSHGGSWLPQRILKTLFDAGALPAEPGEFTRRAFLNGKMDLTQAEAVADLIAAKSESACRIAERQLSGALGKRIRGITETLYHLLAEIESRLDFPEESLDWMPPEILQEKIRSMIEDLRKLLSGKESSAVIRNGVRLVIAGSPNVGKSSLLNLLLGYDRAIVSDIPGTTRDTLRESVTIRNILVDLTDTAGIREHTADPLEELGIARSRNSLQSARIVFWLFDASSYTPLDLERMNQTLPPDAPVIVVWNKVDLCSGFQVPETGRRSVVLSTKTRAGLDALLDLFEDVVWGGGDRSEPECAVSVRHVRALEDTIDFLSGADQEISSESYELAASNLHNAMRSATSVTGESATPDILEEIFSKFCIGK